MTRDPITRPGTDHLVAAQEQVALLARRWALALDGEPRVTASGLVCFAHRDAEPVVLKLPRSDGDEAMASDVLEHFQGHGAVRLLERTLDGGILIERAEPGRPLTDLVIAGDDVRATEIVCEVIAALHEIAPGNGTFPYIEDWADGFARYRRTGDQRVSAALIDRACGLFADLAASQGPRRLLHGDLHHDNILFDARRGWLAIDPKGVFGETAYEVGAALRNPTEDPVWFATPSIIDRRVSIFSERLDLNRVRVLGWAFAQAVLSAVWSIEDGLDPARGLATAAAIAPMLFSYGRNRLP